MAITTRHEPATTEQSRAKRLKAATIAVHETLDQRIMAAEPFRDRDRYGRFLWMQYEFHRDIDALYRHPALEAVLPDLAGRRRLDAIAHDLDHLALPIPEDGGAPAFGAGPIDLPTAFGWLYVAEGSNLGAAFLYKAAVALGFDASHGARHLAGHPDGRARHWREFTAALDTLDLSEDEDARVSAGARAAFSRVHELVGATLG
ncbi:biliverdin-producing heme oxygenase [Sphingomonas sp. TDK1]|uniref:biliverdin-producing heme oxygenase n=1 Tax=Sphingomonas sp. TDK1 TaxID=453247 RepID=UPI0007D9C4E1|nr:biliverdin-producing heme oxygenase [Sphingomonas sp. TDK1]OAN59923.1 heme oxygenase [Sphingomonas sp. TDK1]